MVQEALQSCSTPSSKGEILRTLRDRTLEKFAAVRGYIGESSCHANVEAFCVSFQKIALGCTADRVAWNAFMLTIGGRGAAVKRRADYKHTHPGGKLHCSFSVATNVRHLLGVTSVQPLRDMLLKEAVFYNHFTKMRSLRLPEYAEREPSSIANITEGMAWWRH